MKDIHFTFSDTIAGYVSRFDWDRDTFVMETAGGATYEVKLTANTYAELVRNLGDGFIDCSGDMRNMLGAGRFLYAYGVFFPEQGQLRFEAKHLVFLGREIGEFRFERQDWWIKQVKALGDFYLRAQFGDGPIDFARYRTMLNLEGEQTGNIRQETDTISRLVYGFASAYMMTGEDRFLEAAEAGTKYLRDHMRCVDGSANVTFWYHGIDLLTNGHERKIFASEFGDDYDAIPAYEQIYALAGPTQTFRITGDPAILQDVEMTCNLFDKYFIDRKLGGYFSHVDPVSFDPRSETLGHNRARKNWNSVGDHAPAYLINVVLATEEPRYKAMLLRTADTITEHFQDYDNSPFVQEKFHEDWSHDSTWGWQQNRGVVGHNLKIAWNLTRLFSLEGKQEYADFAARIAELMPGIGGDPQRGGWYDVMERTKSDDQDFHRFAWHDRKAWWQQEQGILAFMILAGAVHKPEYLKLARESAAFYNAWFLDHDSGGIYFNVLAEGMPYLLGTERMKGSHSMSGYHSFELAYLAAVYSNLLLTKQHLDLYFKPYPHAFADGKLRVAPDLLPEGSIELDAVWIEGKPYENFDRKTLTVNLPQTGEQVRVRARVTAVGTVEHFSAVVDHDGDILRVTMSGDLDHRAIPGFRKQLSEVVAGNPQKSALVMDDLQSMNAEGVRTIVFEKQKMSIDADLYICGANDEIRALFECDEFVDEITLLDSYDPAKMN
ncbi:MAG: AGE family epimerase/isomerase [Candidatus Thiodiazotropha sp. (ex Epidulcina cf. delphinae)]|nr:AGE family epimerase/isomerase [Candidatus Thiodiazotropha sp. (ex Epidulcina cf. delphinae)]